MNSISKTLRGIPTQIITPKEASTLTVEQVLNSLTQFKREEQLLLKKNKTTIIFWTVALNTTTQKGQPKEEKKQVSLIYPSEHLLIYK